MLVFGVSQGKYHSVWGLLVLSMKAVNTVSMFYALNVERFTVLAGVSERGPAGGLEKNAYFFVAKDSWGFLADFLQKLFVF